MITKLIAFISAVRASRKARKLLKLANELAPMTTNTIDDRLVAALNLAMANKDYGLQRKPTGKRGKKA